MGELVLAARMIRVPTMQMSERDGPLNGGRQVDPMVNWKRGGPVTCIKMPGRDASTGPCAAVARSFPSSGTGLTNVIFTVH